MSHRTPSVLNRRIHGVPKGAVIVHRPTKWGNPTKYTKAQMRTVDWTAEMVQYEAHVRSRPELMAALGELVGKDLVCWCVPDHPCHAEVLLRMAEEFAANSKRV